MNTYELEIWSMKSGKGPRYEGSLPLMQLRAERYMEHLHMFSWLSTGDNEWEGMAPNEEVIRVKITKKVPIY